MMFSKLKALRDKLASVPAFAVDPDTRVALVAAIDDLDDAMVADVRAQEAKLAAFRASLPQLTPCAVYDLAERLALSSGIVEANN